MGALAALRLVARRRLHPAAPFSQKVCGIRGDGALLALASAMGMRLRQGERDDG